MCHLLPPLLGEALSHAPILNIWTHTRGPSQAFPCSRDGLSLHECWLRSALTAWTAHVSWDDLCSCHAGGFGEILRSPCPRSREGVREGVVLTAQEAGLVEAVAFTLHLLSKVDGLLAHPTLLPSSPVWHPAGESTVRNRGRALQGRGGAAGAGTEAPAAFPHPQVQRAPTVFAGCTDCRAGKEQNQKNSGTQHPAVPAASQGPLILSARSSRNSHLGAWELTAPVSARKKEEAVQCWEMVNTELPRHLLRSQPSCHPMPWPG